MGLDGSLGSVTDTLMQVVPQFCLAVLTFFSPMYVVRQHITLKSSCVCFHLKHARELA